MALRKIDVNMLHAFQAEVEKAIPGMHVGFKTDSFLQRALGFFAYPFNPKYMTHFTTTLGKGVWFPTKEYYEGQPQSSLKVLAHELVHLHDEERLPLLMMLGVVFPQVLCLIPFALYPVFAGWDALIVYGIAVLGTLLSLTAARLSSLLFYVLIATTLLSAGAYAVFTTGWLALVLVAGAVALAPWPSPSRTHFELRGYAMQVAMTQWIYGEVSMATRESICENFVGSSYYFMSWSRAHVMRRIDEYAKRAASGELQQEAPYDLVYRFCLRQGLVHDPSETSGTYVVGG